MYKLAKSFEEEKSWKNIFNFNYYFKTYRSLLLNTFCLAFVPFPFHLYTVSYIFYLRCRIISFHSFCAPLKAYSALHFISLALRLMGTTVSLSTTLYNVLLVQQSLFPSILLRTYERNSYFYIAIRYRESSNNYTKN